MKTALAAILGAAVAFITASALVAHRQAARHAAQVADHQAAWQAERAELETALAEAAARAAARVPAPIPPVAPAAAPASTRLSPPQIIARLQALRPTGNPGPGIREAAYWLEELRQSGPAALPVIREAWFAIRTWTCGISRCSPARCDSRKAIASPPRMTVSGVLWRRHGRLLGAGQLRHPRPRRHRRLRWWQFDRPAGERGCDGSARPEQRPAHLLHGARHFGHSQHAGRRWPHLSNPAQAGHGAGALAAGPIASRRPASRKNYRLFIWASFWVHLPLA